MAMFAVYLDDSGSHEGDHRYVMGGYISSVCNWLKFAQEWDSELSRMGLEDEGFHMTDAEANPNCPQNRPPPYNTWTAEDRENNVTKMASIVGRHAMRGIAVHLMRSDYEEMISKPGLARLGPMPEPVARDVRDPLMVLYQHALFGVAHACDSMKIPRGNVDIFFSKQPRIGLARDSGEAVWGALGFNEPLWRPMKENVGLQAADMFSWAIQKYTQSDGSLKQYPRHAHLFDPPRTVGPIGAESMRKLADHLAPFFDRAAQKLSSRADSSSVVSERDA